MARREWGKQKRQASSAIALQHIKERQSKANEQYWALQVEIQQTSVAAWANLAAGKKQEALQQMKLAAELEDGTEKSAVTPGPLAPARELLGEMFLQMNEPAHALEQFEATLKKEPGRFRALYGAARAAQLNGDRDTSQKYFLELTCCLRSRGQAWKSRVTRGATGGFAELSARSGLCSRLAGSGQRERLTLIYAPDCPAAISSLPGEPCRSISAVAKSESQNAVLCRFETRPPLSSFWRT